MCKVLERFTSLWLDGRTPNLSRFSRVWLILGGFFVLLCAAHWGEFSGPAALLTYPVVAACCAAMLVGSLRDDSAIPQSSALVRLGRIYYGLYVFHAFSLRFANQFIHLRQPQLIENAVRIACAGTLTLVLSAASYRWLESPFLRLKERFAHVQSIPNSNADILPNIDSAPSYGSAS